MKRLKILEKQSDFETQYPDGIPSNDVVLVKENDKLYMATNNANGTYAEYGATGGTIDPSVIDELGLVTVDMIENFVTVDDISTKLDANDISTLVSVNDASVYVKLDTTNMGNLYIGSNTSTAGYSVAVRRLFNNLESISLFSNADFRTSIANRVGSVNNARMILTHEGLEVAYSGNRDTAFGTSKHVTYVEDTSANFAQKNDISTFISLNDVQAEGYLKQNNVSTFITLSDVQAEGYLKQNNVSTFITMNDVEGQGYLKQNNVSTFVTLNDVSNHALKSELDYIVWQGTQAQYEGLANHTDYKIYLITE